MIMSHTPNIIVYHSSSPQNPMSMSQDVVDSNGVPVACGTMRYDGMNMYVMSNGSWNVVAEDTHHLDSPMLDEILREREQEKLLLEKHPELAEMRDKYLFMKRLVSEDG